MTQVSLDILIKGAIAGKVVSFPTDTVPALAVLPEHADLIFALKKRPPDKPLILMGASITALSPYITGTVAELAAWGQMAQCYWPGQLTLVLPASSQVSALINPINPATVGIRVPAHPIAQAILAQTGPLATTSANLSGEAPLESMSAIENAFPDVLTLANEGLETAIKLGSGLPSTVAKWTGQGWEILRQGSIRI